MSRADLDTADTVELSPASPVFADPSGRRRKLLRRFVVGVCVLVGLYVAALAAALLGAPIPSSALLPLPAADQPAPMHSSAPAPPASSSGAPTSTAGDRAGPEATTTSRVAAGVPPAAPTTTPAQTGGSTPAETTTSDSRNPHAPAVPPGKETTTGRRP